VPLVSISTRPLYCGASLFSKSVLTHYRNAPLDVQRLHIRKRKEGYSPRTVQYIHTVLSASLRFAVTMRIVGSNPAKEVERPKGGSLIEPRALTEDECKHLLDVAKDDWYYPVYVTALQTGMRMGELFGLYWDDVDFERKVIMVRRAAKKMRGGWGIGELKTKASYRTISISDYLVDVLEAHQEEQEESFGEINLVFVNGHLRIPIFGHEKSPRKE
jgi:integrase